MHVHQACLQGWRAVRRSRRLLALAGLVDALICLPATVYVVVAVHRSAAHRLDATEIAGRLDLDFMADLRGGGTFDESLTSIVAATLLLFFLVRPLIKGGYVGIASQARRLRFALFMRQGGTYYWKFLRIACLGALVAYLLSLAARPLLEYIEEQSSSLLTEGQAHRYRRITEGVVFAAFWVGATILDYTRVGIHMHRRRGVLVELARSSLFVLQHPLRTLGLSAVAFVLELAVVWTFVHVLRAVDGAYLVTSVVMLFLVQLLVILREATRLFHLAGAWHIRRDEEGARTLPESAGASDDDDLLENLPWNR